MTLLAAKFWTMRYGSLGRHRGNALKGGGPLSLSFFVFQLPKKQTGCLQFEQPSWIMTWKPHAKEG